VLYDDKGTPWFGSTFRYTHHHLHVIQQMLFSLGIKSKLFNKSDLVLTNHEPYSYEANIWHINYSKFPYVLAISAESFNDFNRIIRPTSQPVAKRLESLSKHVDEYVFKQRIVKIEECGEEKVYDCQVEDIHAFVGNGFVLHNCGEIALHSNQMCNLTELNVADPHLNQKDLNQMVRAAAILGTLQATYTDFHLLRPCWQATTEREALLGIGMTGIASGAILHLDLKEAARVALDTNAEVAARLGINKAARIGCVKPSGTTSCVLGCSSGIHDWHAPYYLRRVRVGKNEPVYKYLKEQLPDLVEDDALKPNQQAVFAVPQQAPEGALCGSSATALLERVKYVYDNWILPSHRSGNNTHNVSCTVDVGESEWDGCVDWLWENRDSYSGITLYPKNDAKYAQAPFEAIAKEKFDLLVKGLHSLDFKAVKEDDDNTKLTEQAACVGGACALV
jgi:hypothetical protein